MNKIEITVLSARVLDALSGRGLKAKTVHEFERYGTRRIVKHCLGKGQILYSKETVQNFVWQERAKQESGTLPHYQWGITRRAAVYLDQMAEYGKIQDEPIRPWEAEHNPLFQAISCNPSNSMKVIDIICRTRDAVMQLELSDKTKTNYIYCGFGAILNFFISRGEESYSPESLTVLTGMPANCVWYKRKQTSLYPYRLIQKLEMRLPITFSMPGPSANLSIYFCGYCAPIQRLEVCGR